MIRIHPAVPASYCSTVSFSDGPGSAPPDGLHADPQRTSRDEISILALAIAAWVAAGPIRMSRITKRRDLIAAEEVPTVFDEARIRDSAKIGKLPPPRWR